MARKGDDMANTSGRRPARSAGSRGDIASLEQTVQDLQRTVMLIAEANAVPNLLANSFDEISAQLAPLRNLAPYVEPMSRHALAVLRHLRRDHARPDWGALGGQDADGQQRFIPN
jgi:hypothetical protein